MTEALARIQAKQRELDSLKTTLQREYDMTVIAEAKTHFPAHSFVQSITSVQIDKTKCSFHNVSFLIIGDTWQLKTQEGNKLFYSSLRKRESKLIPIANPSKTLLEHIRDTQLSVNVIRKLQEDESPSDYMIRAFEFWAHLEAFLIIYVDNMSKCPDQDKRPVKLEDFILQFGLLKQ